ncbi:MoaD/ThiS family protein [Hyalangium sp.]|uniref:MoaD/ThiS family protein n=1 Tax=Hyalangium sp. TaxID=2028555 RepID=UPI002D22B1C7|nr:MoaD/ThiS family protein [Hyalangium sp.]HYH97232.1 MoaD/ThiS family protein [Hyalangium sp.]
MRFRFSGTLLRFTDFQKEIQVQAPTLGEALVHLVSQHERLKPVLLDNNERLRGIHRLFLNGEQLLEVQPQQPLADGDCLEFVTAVAGG